MGDREAAFDADATVKQQLNGLRIQSMLNGVDLPQEGRFGVARTDRHRFLEEDGPVIHLLIDQMDRHPRHFGPPRQRITNGVRSGERRQERRVDVQDAMAKATDENRRENPHEPCKADKPHTVRLAALNEGLLVLRARIRSRINVLRVHTGSPRPLQRIRVRTITQDEGDARA